MFVTSWPNQMSLVVAVDRYLGLPLAMSTPPNNERSPRKWFKQKIRSVFPSKSRNLDVPDAQHTSTNVPPIDASFIEAQARGNSPSDGTTDRTGPGE
jgi:hypothetical protein